MRAFSLTTETRFLRDEKALAPCGTRAYLKLIWLHIKTVIIYNFALIDRSQQISVEQYEEQQRKPDSDYASKLHCKAELAFTFFAPCN